MRNTRTWLIALACTLPTVGAIAQPNAPSRSGFYASLGLGYGSLSCSGCSSTNSGAGYLALGGTLNPKLRLGFESQAWTKSESGTTLTVYYYLASLSIYPNLENGFWVKLNAGWTNASEAVSGFGSASSNGGFAGGAGIGYDWAPGRGTFAIIPFATYTAQLSSSAGEGKSNLLAFGVGLGYKH